MSTKHRLSPAVVRMDEQNLREIDGFAEHLAQFALMDGHIGQVKRTKIRGIFSLKFPVFSMGVATPEVKR